MDLQLVARPSPSHWVGLLAAGYLIAATMGLAVGRIRPLPPRFFLLKRRFSADPLTVWLHQRLRPIKSRCMNERRWVSLFGLVFFNNLVLAALISRVLYGLLFFLPAVLVLSGAFALGAITNQPEVRRGLLSPLCLLLVLEFGGYVVAAAIGTHAGLALWFPPDADRLSALSTALRDCDTLAWIATSMLGLGACAEVGFLRMAASVLPPGFPLSFGTDPQQLDPLLGAARQRETRAARAAKGTMH